jgi:hypothetical protein
MASSRFKYLCFDEEKKMTAEIEKVVKRRRHNTSEAKIVQEVKASVDDPPCSRTRETKYFKLAKI